MTALEIESEQIVANEVFTNRLIAVCDAAKCDIFYETIKDEASYCPTYCIYKTNINEDFLSLPLTHRDNCLLYGDEYITTDYSDNKAVDTIIGIKLLQNIEISSLQRVNGRILNGSVFYADNNHVDDLKRELIENGFQVAILSNQFIEGDNQWNLAVAFFYVILLVTILLYFLSIGKEIVIKKVCGYSNLLIFQEKFRSILFTVLMVIVFETCTIIAIFFKDLKSICHFIQYISYENMSQIFAICFCIIISSYFTLTQREVTEIRGKSNYTGTFVVSLVAKLIVVAFSVLYISSGVQTISVYGNMIHKMENYCTYMDKWYTIPYNTLSIDINGNIKEIEQKSTNLFHYFMENIPEDDILILSIEDYFDNSNSESGSIMLANRTYLSMNDINYANGIKISATDKPINDTWVLVPENINSIKGGTLILNSFLKDIQESDSNVQIIYYESGSKLKSFSLYEGDKEGDIYNAILFMPSDNYLKSYAMDWFSNENYMLRDSTGNLETIIQNGINEFELQDVIIEVNSIVNRWKSEVFLQRLRAARDKIIIIVCFMALFIASTFYIAVYINNQRKRIAISKLNGYGMLAYFDYYIQVVFIVGLSFVMNLFILVPSYVHIWLVLTEILCLYVVDRRMEEDTLRKILKGAF